MKMPRFICARIAACELHDRGCARLARAARRRVDALQLLRCALVAVEPQDVVAEHELVVDRFGLVLRIARAAGHHELLAGARLVARRELLELVGHLGRERHVGQDLEAASLLRRARAGALLDRRFDRVLAAVDVEALRGLERRLRRRGWCVSTTAPRSERP
jgi:hypothetical protein